MRKVTLYTLKQEEVMVTGESLNWNLTQFKPVRIRGTSEFVIDTPEEVTRLPVEQYFEYNMYRGDEEYLVAFDPKIRKLLHINEGKLKSDLSQALEVNWIALEYRNKLLDENTELAVQNSKLTKNNGQLTEMYQQYCVKYFRFVNLSFWKRLVFLFTGKVKEL